MKQVTTTLTRTSAQRARSAPRSHDRDLRRASLALARATAQYPHAQAAERRAPFADVLAIQRAGREGRANGGGCSHDPPSSRGHARLGNHPISQWLPRNYQLLVRNRQAQGLRVSALRHNPHGPLPHCRKDRLFRDQSVRRRVIHSFSTVSRNGLEDEAGESVLNMFCGMRVSDGNVQ